MRENKEHKADSRSLSEARQSADSADASAALPLEAAGIRAPSGLLPKVTTRSVLALSLPAIGDQLVQATIGLTDALVAGHISADGDTVAAAAAAVGVMMYVQWLSGLLNSAFGVGATAIVARAIGARRPRVANRVAGTAIASALVVSALIAVVLFTGADVVASLTGLRGKAHEFGVQYLHIMSLTIALQAAWQIGIACLRGAGDTVRPLLITSAVAVINIFTSICFTFGYLGLPAMGVRGIALGTMMAYLIGGSATLVLLLSGSSRLKLRLAQIRITPHILARLVRIGFPSWLEGVLLWAGQFAVVVLVINANDAAVGLDGATMAAHTTVLRVESLAFLPGFGFGIACATLVGQYLGAKRPEEARHAAILCGRLAAGTMIAAALPMVLFPRQVLSLMLDSPVAVELAVWPMVLAGLAQPGFAYAIARGSALRGAGETMAPMIATLGGIFVVRVPIIFGALWLFHRAGHADWGLLAVWIGVWVDLSFRGILNSATFARGKWMYKKV